MDMDARRTQVLRDIIEISEAMLVMARENQWERVALLETERRMMVNRMRPRWPSRSRKFSGSTRKSPIWPAAGRTRSVPIFVHRTSGELLRLFIAVTRVS